MDLVEKRPAEGGGEGVREVKRVKRSEVVENVKEVAERVLVLAAMAKMRGGRVPSEAERELMAEAREKLAEVCQVFAPKDVFPRDAFGGVIEDLGLNKLKEQRLGFRPPKMSISEKLALSKRKFQMEKSEEFALPPATSSQRLQGISSASVESRGTSLPIRVTPSDKPSVPISTSSLQPSATVHVAATNSTSLPYQLPTSEVRPIAANALPPSHSAQDSSSLILPRVVRPQFRVDGRPNASPVQVQGQAHSAGNQTTARTPPWLVQPQSVSSSKVRSDNKVPVKSIKVDGTVDVKPRIPQQHATTKLHGTQIATGNQAILHQNLQGVNYLQVPPMRNTHAEVGNIIQKFLHPRQSERLAWTPPSRDYMNKHLNCQICQATSSEVDNVLICDNCEKGFHLKCLQTANHKAALRGEWHCFKCLSISNGKPLPPKYGRVMRNNSTAKMSSNTAPVHQSVDKKAGIADEKVNLQKVMSNGNTTMQSSSSGSTCSQPGSESKLTTAILMQGNQSLSSNGKMDEKVSSGTYLNNTSSMAHVLSSERPSEEKKLVDLKAKSLENSEPAPSTSENSQAPGNLPIKEIVGLSSSIEMPSQQYSEHHLTVNDSTKHGGSQFAQTNLNREPKRDELGVLPANPAETATTSSGNTVLADSSSAISCSVDWVGDVFQVEDEKTYYKSCHINGIVYKLHDHVLVRFDKGKLIPSKLQSMWEDSKTRMKWITINRCYFPNDLPEAVGRPCSLESNEVYESSRSITLMASLIQGPCKVLPPNKFEAEKERRVRLGVGTDGLRTLYLCKWIYDETKGLFRDVSC